MALNIQRTILRAIGAREQPVTVTAVDDVLPWYRRVHFSAPEFLSGLEVFPTVWIRLWVPSLDDPTVLRQRGYTLVDPDPAAGTFALEFVLHQPAGAAARWAETVRVGDSAEIAFTPARIDPDPAIGTYVIGGDASALPAINSLLDHIPDHATAHVVFTDPHDDAAELPFRTRENTRLSIVRTGAEQLRLLRALDVDADDVYAWGAGERSDVSGMRQLFRREWALPKHRQHTQYYWIRGKTTG
ncbi:siderophore-interacting protein [Nocardiopsis sp. NPDC049922]|uniref:siderophore-interacting protein n=1 Tax=Nocardiopsis sp. NPDC049922 TaxID=3155157 RepID=UPI0033FD5D17